LLSETGDIKIIDFGLSKNYGSPKRNYSTGVVTRYYRAPEILFGAV
jgi:serine/threonine protein kinase